MVVVRFENALMHCYLALPYKNVLSAAKCLASTRFETEAPLE
jgi:hypothetical protein